MATHGPINLPAYQATDAQFREWVQGVHDAISALGLVQTADTGQINPTTVAVPTGYATFMGYEIWRFDDALQSDTPVFIKLEYGSSNSAALTPAIKLAVGSASNGSGTLTGQLITSSKTVNSGAPSGADVTLPLYASGGPGELILACNMNASYSGPGIFFSIERPKNSLGEPTDDGVICHFGSSTGVSSSYIPKTGSTPPDQNSWCSVTPYFWQRAASGENSDAVPVFIPLGGVWRFSSLLITHLADFPAGGVMSCDIFGGTHTYMAMDDKVGPPYLGGVSNGFAMRWE